MLKTVIYADVLIFINVMVNYLLLRASAAISSSAAKPGRFLASSFAGGVFSLTVFLDGIPAVFQILMKLAFSAIMILIAFGFVSPKAFMKRYVSFFLVNFAFAGIMLALCCLPAGKSLIYKNGAVYFDVDILTLTVTSVICYGVICLISFFFRGRVPQKIIYDISLFCGERSILCRALLDTGNNLRDIFSGRPVIIADAETVRPLIPAEAIDENGNVDFTEIKGFRLVPFTTVKNGGALPAFPLEKAEICDRGRIMTVENLFVGVTEKKLTAGEFSVIIGTPVFESISKNERSDSNEKNHYSDPQSDTKNKIRAVRGGSGLHKRAGHPSAAADRRKGNGVSQKA